MTGQPITVSVLGVDIEGFSRRTMREQQQLQRDLLLAVHDACEAIGLDILDEDRQETGDGSMNLVRADVDVACLAADLPRELALRLHERNSDRLPTGRLRLRVAVHQGPVGIGPAWQGDTVVATRRLLDADESRQVLAAEPRADLVLVVSQTVFDDAVKHRRRGLAAEDFAPVVIGDDEKGAGIQGWACLWGRTPIPPSAGTDDVGPVRTRAGKRPETLPPGARYAGSTSGQTSFGDHSVNARGDVTIGGPAPDGPGPRW